MNCKKKTYFSFYFPPTSKGWKLDFSLINVRPSHTCPACLSNQFFTPCVAFFMHCKRVCAWLNCFHSLQPSVGRGKDSRTQHFTMKMYTEISWERAGAGERIKPWSENFLLRFSVCGRSLKRSVGFSHPPFLVASRISPSHFNIILGLSQQQQKRNI